MTETNGTEISVAEKKIIDDLRANVAREVDQKTYDDVDLFHRYLKANNFNISSAENMLRKTLQWRRQLRVDTILKDYEPPEVLKKCIGNTVFASDKNGTPVHYLPLGKMDSKGIIMSCKYTDLEKTFAQIIERDEDILMENRKTPNGPYPGYFYIYDMDGLNFAKATDKKGIETSIHILRLYQNYYPDRLKAAYIINASSFFYYPFAIVKNFMDAFILKNIRIYGTDGWQEELLKLIDAVQLPAFLGGKKTDPDGNPLCQTMMLQGGKVDQSFHLQKSKKALSSHAGAKRLVLARASFSEIEVEIEEPASLIEWEFETKTRDIGFGLFHKEMTGDEEKITELVPLLRLDTESYVETGMFQCEQAGTYVILFDNSYSWIRSKEIYYRTKIISRKITKVRCNNSLEDNLFLITDGYLIAENITMLYNVMFLKIV